jgi:hypothetical protein
MSDGSSFASVAFNNIDGISALLALNAALPSQSRITQSEVR